MKTKLLFLSICLFCATMGFAQNRLFEKYADTDNVTSVYISKAMFNMMPNLENAGVNFTNLKGKIESLQLVSTEKKDLAAQMKREFSGLVTSRHEELMRVRDGNSRINFYSNNRNGIITELIMLVESENNFTAILLEGNFTLKEIQDIANQY